MQPIDPALLTAVAEQSPDIGPVWSRPAATLATLAGDAADASARLQTFRRALAEGYFTQYTAYSDPEYCARVVDWQLAAMAADGVDLLPDLAESPLVRPETVSVRGGRAVSPDFLRYLWYADTLRKHGVLDRPRPRVVEIGSGYGGLARVLKHLAPTATVYLVDLPASLVYADLFLRAEFPHARLVVAADGVPAGAIDADFVLVPAHRAGCLRGAAVDLAMNVWSFGEIPNEVNRGWFRLLQDEMRVDWLFTLNSFLKRVGIHSRNELSFGRWLTFMDERWRVAGFEVDPRVHRCPYMTNFPNGAAILARRIGTAAELDAERAKARTGFEPLAKADWASAAGPDGGDPGPFIEASHYVGRWHDDPGADGTLFRLWQQVRLNADPRAVRLLLTYIRHLRGKGGDGFRFKDEFYFRELLSPDEVAREADGFFYVPPPPVPTPPPQVTFSIQEACDFATIVQNTGQLGAAEDLYRRILAAVPGHGECMFQLGAIAERRHDAATALGWYLRACALAPDNPNYRGRAFRTAAEIGWRQTLSAGGRSGSRERCWAFVRSAYSEHGLTLEGDAASLPPPEGSRAALRLHG